MMDPITRNAVICLCIAMALVVFSCFCVFLLLHGLQRGETANRLAASIMLGQAFFTLIHQSGIIHMKLLNRVMAKGFCFIYAHLEMTYQYFIPLSLLVYVIDRLMFIKDPIGYAQKHTKIGIVIMLLFPWVLAVVVTTIIVAVLYSNVVVEVKPFYPLFDVNSTTKICFYSGAGMNDIENHVLQVVICIQVLVSFISTIVVLVMWCCYKCNNPRRNNYSLMGDEIENMVKKNVIGICVINVFCIIMYFLEVSMFNFIRTHFFLQPLDIFGFVEGLVFICTLKGTCDTFKQYCCCCCRKKYELKDNVNYKSRNDDVNISG